MTDIQVAGRSKLYIGLPASPSSLSELGEQRDETRIEIQSFTHDVQGDSHGGPQGPPIEKQMLGQIARCTFELTKWDHALRAALEQHAVFATEGTIADSEIGALMMKEKAFRVLVKNTRDNTPNGGSFDPFTRNFVCALVSSPVVVGQGTKHSILTFTMEAHRAPVGHANAGILYNRDTSGIPV